MKFKILSHKPERFVPGQVEYFSHEIEDEEGGTFANRALETLQGQGHRIVTVLTERPVLHKPREHRGRR